jgi:TolB-like protein
VNLYREFFYMMATTNYRLGRDGDAVTWFQRIESDENLKKLKERLPPEAPVMPSRDDRLEQLRVKPLTVLPFAVEGGGAEDRWLKIGLAEVLAGDLLNHTDLRLVERTQLEGVLSETKLAVSGLISEASLQEIGRLLQAGTLLVGSVTLSSGGWTVAVRLVDAETAEILGAASGPATPETVINAVRELALKVLRSVNFVGETAAADVAAAHAPAAKTVRALAQARLLLANKGASAAARQLYEDAVRDDPAYANLFDDLKARYADIAATVGVAPFVNVTGSATDQWLVLAVQEGLATDLDQLHFHVVERGQLQALLARQAAGESLSPESARSLGEMLSADIMVLGAVTHQAPMLRLDARFVEVRTGSVLLSASGVDRHDNIAGALSALASDVARRFNEPMSEATRQQLASHRPSKEEFEAHARAELAREALGRGVQQTTPPPMPLTAIPPTPAPTRPVPWLGIVTAGIGTAAAATGFTLGSQHNAYASYYLALENASGAASERSSYSASRSREATQALGWDIAGFVGLALAATGVGIVTFDLANAVPHSAENGHGAGQP